MEQPGNIPISVTQEISDLRLAHAQALEEVGAAKAQLRSREGEIVDLQQREEEAVERIKALEGQVKALDGRKQQVGLLEREVGFWKALVASFQKENEQSPDERVTQLETIIADYKETMETLTAELETLRAMVPQEQFVLEKEAHASSQAGKLCIILGLLLLTL